MYLSGLLNVLEWTVYNTILYINACVRCFPLFTITGVACANNVNLSSKHHSSA